MSLRNIPTQFEANVKAAHVMLFTLAEFQLDSGTLRMTDLPHDVTWNGVPWLGAFGVASIDEVPETAAEARGLSFTLTATSDSLLASALDENIQGRPCILRLATLTPGTTQLAVDEDVWKGTLDATYIKRNDKGSQITITAEHALARWDKPNLIRHSHEDQQLLYPGDKFYEYAAKLAEAVVIWPAKEFLEK